LSAGKVFEPGEAVVTATVAQAHLVHLSREPLPTVEAHLDVERKPGLDASVHKTQHGMNVVAIQKQALSQPRLQLNLPRLAIAIHVEALARLDAR
jgi:hypothetical protein